MWLFPINKAKNMHVGTNKIKHRKTLIKFTWPRDINNVVNYFTELVTMAKESFLVTAVWNWTTELFDNTTHKFCSISCNIKYIHRNCPVITEIMMKYPQKDRSNRSIKQKASRHAINHRQYYGLPHPHPQFEYWFWGNHLASHFPVYGQWAVCLL